LVYAARTNAYLVTAMEPEWIKLDQSERADEMGVLGWSVWIALVVIPVLISPLIS
jgi:hypothetical protein